jgi:hypothetical protein
MRLQPKCVSMAAAALAMMLAHEVMFASNSWLHNNNQNGTFVAPGQNSGAGVFSNLQLLGSR